MKIKPVAEGRVGQWNGEVYFIIHSCQTPHFNLLVRNNLFIMSLNGDTQQLYKMIGQKKKYLNYLSCKI